MGVNFAKLCQEPRILGTGSRIRKSGGNGQEGRDMRVDSDPRVPVVGDDINLDPHRLVLVGVFRVRLISSFDVGCSCIFNKGLSNCNYGKWRGQHFLPHSNEIWCICRGWRQESSVWSRQKLLAKKSIHGMASESRAWAVPAWRGPNRA
jgi:hypothetical protein